MGEESFSEQREELWDYWSQQIETRVAPELAEMKSALNDAFDDFSMTQEGRHLGTVHLLEQVHGYLVQSKESGAAEHTVQETALRQVVSRIENPLLRQAVEATGNFILKVERETEMPPINASVYYFRMLLELVKSHQQI